MMVAATTSLQKCYNLKVIKTIDYVKEKVCGHNFCAIVIGTTPMYASDW